MVDLCWQEYFWFFGANLSRAWALVMTGFSYPIHSNPSQVKPIQSESSWVELNCVELSWAEWSRLNIRNLYILLINLLILGQLLFCLFADLVNPDRADQPPTPRSPKAAVPPVGQKHTGHICAACKSLSSRLKINQIKSVNYQRYANTLESVMKQISIDFWSHVKWIFPH